jgi:hypothetical protein
MLPGHLGHLHPRYRLVPKEEMNDLGCAPILLPLPHPHPRRSRLYLHFVQVHVPRSLPHLRPLQVINTKSTDQKSFTNHQ